MGAITVTQIPLPQNSLVIGSLCPIHYGDAYRMALPKHFTGGVDELTELIFSPAANPSWAARLARLRNGIVRFFGLKTMGPSSRPSEGAGPSQPAPRRRLFPVIERTGRELLLGLDDRHLDFRISVQIVDNGADRWGVVTTVVRFHNLLGRAYFLPVKPIHRRMVPAIMKKAVAAWEKANPLGE
ncbi:DUF2867 domain-containing protein [Heliobacterium gestii]|uniref:DUF2867 domain-containing protein n=1 Tax=Heliomicrobium gestii TaxID=2699 RepID=A0A845L7F2_HELGE|nr:DUF2867 domain-containing protein [Heliomicrobium gestii]MBM7866031.1 hypothetical protein [Heliomicrobium gestii]MZP42637.1 DUF2867 domain-containing protein [Heliomicrobium gestii]